jgi:hypothetical protein
MTTEDILHKGIQAAAILNNEDIMSFISTEKALLLECIANTQAHESKTRESLYFQHSALNGFLQSLKQYVDAAESIVKASEEPEDMTD